MSFEITITETKSVEKEAGGEWKIVDTKEVKREKEFFNPSKNESATRIKDIHGYTPQIKKTVVETKDIYRQSVSDLSLEDVIKAVNKIK